jgi:23S rRNA pseudouridine2605 synthase
VVSRLKRTRYGNVFIPSKVKQGMYIELDKKEAKDLYRLAGLPPKPLDDATPLEKKREKRQLSKRGDGKSARKQKSRRKKAGAAP